MEKTKIAIIGAGNWGMTLALYLEKRNYVISLFEPVKERRDDLIKNRENSVFLPGFVIPEGVELTEDLESSIIGKQYIFVVLPSEFFNDMVVKISNIADITQNVVSFTKGLDKNNCKPLSNILYKLFTKERTAVVSGPTIALEIARGLPATAVVASEYQVLAKNVQKILSSSQLRVYTSDDVIGVELGGALKNIIALAAGILEGIELGTNAKAALLTRGMMEMSRLGEALGARRDTFSGLSGFGDLITTAFSKYSRNRTTGERLGRGEKLEDIKKDMVMIAEGVRTAYFAKSIAKELGVEMPITEIVVEVLEGNVSAIEGLKILMDRTLKPEIW